MSEDISELIVELNQLLDVIDEAKNRTIELSLRMRHIGGEFEQEVSIDLESFNTRLQDIWNDMDVVLQEAKTLQNDREELNANLQKGIQDEENYKIEVERMQERIENHRTKEKEEERKAYEKRTKKR